MNTLFINQFQLNVTRSNFMRNVLNVLKFEADQNLHKLRQPVDKNKWSTEPAVVNAFYNPNKNDIGTFVKKGKREICNDFCCSLQCSLPEYCSRYFIVSISRSR